MVVAFVQIGPDVPLGMMAIGNALETGIGRAVEMGLFRCSVVEDPVFGRTNTLTNLPPVIHWFPTDRPGLQISMMLKGFGSENCSALTMLNPTAGAEGVVSAVVDMVAKAGGKPCPPIVVGVGLGGTAERAMLLSKKALLRTTGEPHPNARYARLEQEIEEASSAWRSSGRIRRPLTAPRCCGRGGTDAYRGLPVAARSAVGRQEGRRQFRRCRSIERLHSVRFRTTRFPTCVRPTVA
jgi:fumarate hydratase subunit alpha